MTDCCTHALELAFLTTEFKKTEFTPRTYIKHYDRLLSSSSSGETSTFMSDEEIEKLLDSLRIDPDRRDIRVGGAFHRGLTMGEQKRLEIGLLVLSDPDTVSFNMLHKYRTSPSISQLHIHIVNSCSWRIQWKDWTLKPVCISWNSLKAIVPLRLGGLSLLSTDHPISYGT